MVNFPKGLPRKSLGLTYYRLIGHICTSVFTYIYVRFNKFSKATSVYGDAGNGTGFLHRLLTVLMCTDAPCLKNGAIFITANLLQCKYS